MKQRETAVNHREPTFLSVNLRTPKTTSNSYFFIFFVCTSLFCINVGHDCTLRIGLGFGKTDTRFGGHCGSKVSWAGWEPSTTTMGKKQGEPKSDAVSKALERAAARATRAAHEDAAQGAGGEGGPTPGSMESALDNALQKAKEKSRLHWTLQVYLLGILFHFTFNAPNK